MRPGVRRFALTAHVTVSVGWTGAALVFLVIAAMALTGEDDLTVRGAYVLMERAGWLVLDGEPELLPVSWDFTSEGWWALVDSNH